MMSIINLQEWREENSPHATGKAICMACAYEWVAVIATGEVWFECPACKSNKGHFINHHEFAGLHWTCSCGNMLFYIHKEFVYCPNCGNIQKGF